MRKVCPENMTLTDVIEGRSDRGKKPVLYQSCVNWDRTGNRREVEMASLTKNYNG